MSRLVALEASGDRAIWQSLGLPFHGEFCLVSNVELTVRPGAGRLESWTFLSDTPLDTSIDGIPTHLVTDSVRHPLVSALSQQKIVGLDHVVVNTDNLDRTCEAIESVLHVPVKREREAGNGVVQRFHKLENTIIEVVSGPHVQSTGASLWGFVLSVDDLFEWAQEVGESITSVPKKAVQPGRYISTVRGSVGVGVPIAFMTPHV